MSGRAASIALATNMNTDLTPIKLAAAKPYNGQAQTQAAAAAVRKMVDAGWLNHHDNRWGGKPRVRVSGSGHTPIPNTVRLAFTLPTNNGRPSGATVEQVAVAFETAGWTVERRSNTELFAHGPGLTEWAETRAAHQAESNRIADEQRTRTACEHDELVELLTRYGLSALAERYDTTTTVRMRVADLHELIDAVIEHEHGML